MFQILYNIYFNIEFSFYTAHTNFVNITNIYLNKLKLTTKKITQSKIILKIIWLMVK